MYTIVLAALLTTGNEVPDFGRRGGCHGCYGGCYGGCWGGCYGGCWGGCYGGCWGGCYGGCYGGGCYGGCYGGCGGCYGCGGGCYGGTMIYSSGGCTGMASGGGGGGGAGASRQGGSGGGGSARGAGGSGGQGGGSEELSQNLQELKRSLEQLKKQQNDIRVDVLKQVAEELKLKATEQKIDELRRNVEELRRRVPARPGAVPVPVPGPQPRPVLPAPQPGKGEVLLDLPADALILVNEKRVDAASVFLTPMLRSDQEYAVNVEAVLIRDGKSISRVKQFALHAGEVVRLAYDDMEPAAGRWVRTGQNTAAPAHITVRLPADARLTVQGVECPLTSETRAFDTPVLTPGKAYAYVLRAEVMRDGRPLAQTQRITFRSGERVQVSFEKFDAQSVASR